MMTDERIHDITLAFQRLAVFNLWRCGFSDDTEIDAKALTEAISIACGTMWDYLVQYKTFEANEACLRHAESALREKDKEIQRLKTLLSTNGIKYSKDNNGNNNKQAKSNK